MKKIIKYMFAGLFVLTLCACSINGSDTHKINGYSMGVKMNKEVYTLPMKASELVDKGFLFNNMKFNKKSGEDYLFNGTSKIPEFMIKYKFKKGDALTYKNCIITGLTSDLYGNRTKMTTPEGLGIGATKKQLEKKYGKSSININNEIFIYLDESNTYCYIFENDMF